MTRSSVMKYVRPDVYVEDVVVLPVQTIPGPPLTGARALMAAVFEEAMVTLARHGRATIDSRRYSRPAYLEAHRWISSDRHEEPFDFLYICEVFGWDPGRLRRAIRKWYPTASAPRSTPIVRRVNQNRQRTRRIG